MGDGITALARGQKKSNYTYSIHGYVDKIFSASTRICLARGDSCGSTVVYQFAVL